MEDIERIIRQKRKISQEKKKVKEFKQRLYRSIDIYRDDCREKDLKCNMRDFLDFVNKMD